MPEDASLDQFASSGKTDESELGDSTDSESVDPEATDSEAPEEADDQFEELAEDAAVEPVVSTYEWSPEGGECADCGASVERRWRSEGQRDDALVCADCKEW